MMIKPQKYRIAFVLDALYYPFTYPEIIASLAARKYRIDAAPPQSPLGGPRIYVKGYVASKEGSIIQVNDDRGIIACEGQILNSVLASANEIVGLAESDFQVSIPSDINYCELLASVVVSDCGNPLETIKSFSEDRYLIFDEILGVESAGYSIRIIPKGGNPIEKNWFDISITPRFLTSDTEYYIEIVFRKEKDIETVLSFAEHLHENISLLINKLRGA
jgi:hypothetical protein